MASDRLDAAVDCAVEEMRKAKHTCFDRWTDHDAMRAALLAAMPVLLGEPRGYLTTWHAGGISVSTVPCHPDDGDSIALYAPDLGGGK